MLAGDLVLRQHAPAFLLERAKMKTSPFHPGPLEDLTGEEIAALTAIKQGRKIAPTMYLRLELLDLAEESLCGWGLTPQGDWRLGVGH